MNRQMVKLALAPMVLLCATLVVLAPAEDAEALDPLGFSWDCNTFASCSFNVTTNNHDTYRWNFGDGSGLTGHSSSRSTHHNYTIVEDSTFTVFLLGYQGSNMDNVVGCEIQLTFCPVGGCIPGTSGSC